MDYVTDIQQYVAYVYNVFGYISPGSRAKEQYMWVLVAGNNFKTAKPNG